jgi:predicted Zn-dependent protease
MSTASDLNRFSGTMSDGRTAAATAVQVRFGDAGLEITAPGARRAPILWPYAEIRSGVPLLSGAGDVLLSRAPDGNTTLFIADPEFARLLIERARSLGAGRQRLAGLRPGLAVVALVVLAVAVARFLNFQPSQTIAKLLPQPTREAMGRSVVAQLTGNMRRCETASGRAALDKLTRRLAAVASDGATPVRVVMVDWNLVNAFAAPGGQIIMTRGLVQKAASPDEVAGVLAHEIGHTLELHPEAGLVRAMGLAAAAQLIFAGTTGTATNIGILLTQMRYTRVSEREADAHALRILKSAGISPKGFGDFFQRLEPSPPPAGAGTEKKVDVGKKDEPRKASGFARRIFESEILRTHPLTKDRLAVVRAQPAYAATPALDSGDWRALQDMCGPVTIAPRPGPAGARQQSAPPRTQRAPPPQRSDLSGQDREIAEATRALEANPSDVAALQRRAMAYNRTGRQAEAIRDLTKAIELRPSDANLHSARGGVHYSARQYELALAAYDEALRLDPAHIFARNGRGNTRRALKQFEAAISDFDTLIAARPSYVLTYFNRALTYADMGRQEEAVRDLTSAIAVDGDYAAAYAQRGVLHQRVGARDAAIADYRAALAAPAAKYESGAWAHRTARERLRALGIDNP